MDGAAPGATASSPWWRRALPFVVGLGLIGFTLYRVDLAALGRHLAKVNAPAFLGFCALFVVGLLFGDVFATTLIYRRTLAKISFKEFFILRGASYLPSLLNHHVGQAFITVFLSRAHGVPLARVAGATLLVYASWSALVAGVGCLALVVTGKPLIWVAMILGAGIAYLTLIAIKPKRLAETRLLGPLFEAGLGGHFLAIAARVPHFIVLFLGTWLPFYFFGVRIPVGVALSYVPLLMVAVTLPITPQGFGTRDALAAAFFIAYAPGDTDADKLAAIAATTTSFGVSITLFCALVGLVLLRKAMPALERRDEKLRAERR